MSIRNLDALFKPASVALIGASNRPDAIGSVMARNLLDGGFAGPILPVNPRYRSVHGVLAYPDVASLPLAPDLAIIATPPDTVAALVGELGVRGTRAVVVITAGFGEGEKAEGQRRRQAVLDAARPHLLRVIGPNTVGLLAPNHGLNASFAHLAPPAGHLAFVTQSGAIVTSVIDWAVPRGIGFSHLVSLGGMLDVDFGDMLDYLANDPDTHAILLHIEGITHARKFLSAARAAARSKPVLVVKSGRHPASAQAAASHTGALAGADAVYEAAFRRAGMLRVEDLESLFGAVETLSDLSAPRGRRLGILSNGGGIGVLAADALLSSGGSLATLSDEAVAALDAVLPDTWSRANPIDIIGDAPPARTGQAVAALLAHPEGLDALLVLNCPTAVASPAAVAQALVSVIGDESQPLPLLTSWVGEATAGPGRALLNEAGIATYDTPGQAVRAFLQLVSYGERQALLRETPPSLPEAFTPDTAAARALIEGHLGRSGSGWLGEADAKALLAAYGIPVVETRVAQTPADAGALAEAFGVPVALKILSPDITHKSDVGGVLLGLEGADAVAHAARQMLASVADQRPEAQLAGFTVQPMVRRPAAFELIVGATLDAQFGPVLLFGHGGTAVERIDDHTLELPPLNLRLAREMIGRTRIARLLEGYRNRPAADLDAVALTLVKVAQLLADLGEVVTLDINPLLADADGVIALDARVFVQPAVADAAERLCIRPYPKALERILTLANGRTLLLRPVLPEDEPALRRSFDRLEQDEIRKRFLTPMRSLSHILAARFTQLDYEREMAFVLTEPGIPGQTDIHGVVRLSTDPDNEQAEFAIIVRHEFTGQGLGTRLLSELVDYARSRGIGRLWGLTLRENQRLRDLCRRLGFQEQPDSEDAALVREVLVLGPLDE